MGVSKHEGRIEMAAWRWLEHYCRFECAPFFTCPCRIIDVHVVKTVADASNGIEPRSGASLMLLLLSCQHS